MMTNIRTREQQPSSGMPLVAVACEASSGFFFHDPCPAMYF